MPGFVLLLFAQFTFKSLFLSTVVENLYIPVLACHHHPHVRYYAYSIVEFTMFCLAKPFFISCYASHCPFKVNNLNTFHCDVRKFGKKKSNDRN